MHHFLSCLLIGDGQTVKPIKQDRKEQNKIMVIVFVQKNGTE